MYCRTILRSSYVKVGMHSVRKRFISTEQYSMSELARNSLIYDETEGYVMKSPYGSVIVPNLTIDQYVWKNMKKWQNHVAIECATTGRKYSYAKLRDHCAALAIRMRRNLRLQKGDVVGICLPNVPGNKNCN